MTATERLHLNNSLWLEFTGTVLAVDPERTSIVLDRTAFYAEGGGQLGDRGSLTSENRRFAVRDTQIDDQGQVHHLVDTVDDTIIGAKIDGIVDETHRRDSMSQHTGQHMLSAAFFQVTGAETESARLGVSASTIDLACDRLDQATIHKVEDIVNQLVLEDRPIHPLYPNTEQLAQLSLRRLPKVTKDIRLIDIEDFDITPCGGTHCHDTGQVGPVRIIGQERIKKLTRIHFVAGMRALRYLRERDDLLGETARTMGCGADEILDVHHKHRREIKEQSQLLGKARAALLTYVAKDLHEAHAPKQPYTPIIAVREDDDQASVRKLASTLASRPDVLAVAATRDPKSGDWAVVVERGADVELNVGQWFREQAQKFGGRGGGRPEKAEGRWPADFDWSTFQI